MAAAEQSGGTEARFTVYDATSFLRKPDLARYGIRPIEIVYTGELWDKGENRERLPRETRISRLAHDAAKAKSPVIVDIEHWPTQRAANAQVQASLQKYLAVLASFRNSAPQAQLGYYGMVPIRDYWRAIKGPGAPEYRQWQAENDRLQPLADGVDVLFPSVYTFYTDLRGWEKYAVAQITEARRLAKGKPVYAFLWPNFHESNKLLGGTALPEEFWRLQLETMRKHADGIVIWDGARVPWREDSPWWRVTKEFMESLPKH